MAAGPRGPARVSWEGTGPPVSVSWPQLSRWFGAVRARSWGVGGNFKSGFPPLTSERGRELCGSEEEKRGRGSLRNCREVPGLTTTQWGMAFRPLKDPGRVQPDAGHDPQRWRRRQPEALGAFPSLYLRAGAKATALLSPLEALALPCLGHFPGPSFLGHAPPPRSSPLSIPLVHLALPSRPWHSPSRGCHDPDGCRREGGKNPGLDPTGSGLSPTRI